MLRNGRMRFAFAANFLVAFGTLCVAKSALIWFAASGAEGQTSRLRTMSKLLLCLGWDVVGAVLVAALALYPALRFLRTGRRLSLAAVIAVQVLAGLFVAINVEVWKVLGSPLEKVAIDLAFFNADSKAVEGAARLHIASSVSPYLTLSLGIGLIGSAVVPAWVTARLHRWRLHRLERPLLSGRWRLLLLVPVALFVASALVVPGLANGPAAVHTYGLERSPLPLLLASYARAPLRRLRGTAPAQGDPFCFDQRSPFPPTIWEGEANPISRARPARSNLILVFLESVGSRALEQTPPPMPFLSSLGAGSRSVTFATHYSHWPQTMKTEFTLMCSELPHPDYPPITYLNPAIPCVSLSEALKTAGYETALFNSGDFAFDRRLRFLKHRHFDRLADRNEIPGREGAWSNTWGIDERVTTKAILSWIDGRRGKASPFFVHYTMVSGHHPYEFPGGPAARGLDLEAEARAHRAILAFIDDRLRELMEGLRARGLADQTLVAVVSDHGPGSGRPGMGRVREASVYEGSVRVPLVIVGPQLEGAGGVITFPTAHIDVAPTLLGLLAEKVPTTMKGRDLTKGSDNRLIIVATRPPLSQVAVRAVDWKLVFWHETGLVELFHLGKDPREATNVAHQHPEVVARLKPIAQRWQAHAANLIENYAPVLAATGGRACGRSAGGQR